AGDIMSDFLFASPDFADTMKIPLLDGRDFLPSDSNPSVAIVNRAFALQFFGIPNPTGKWFERPSYGPFARLPSPGGKNIRIQIVGLIPDARSRDNFRRAIRPTAWVPFQSAQPKARGTFVVRTSLRDPLSLAATLRQTVSHT